MSKLEAPGAEINHAKLRCSQCGGSHLRRLPRKGFMQEKIYALFGYFPWECAHCRRTTMHRLRSRRAKQTALADQSSEDSKEVISATGSSQ